MNKIKIFFRKVVNFIKTTLRPLLKIFDKYYHFAEDIADDHDKNYTSYSENYNANIKKTKTITKKND